MSRLILISSLLLGIGTQTCCFDSFAGMDHFAGIILVADAILFGLIAVAVLKTEPEGASFLGRKRSFWLMVPLISLGVGFLAATLF